MAAQRDKSTAAANRRSLLPGYAGLSSVGAVAVATASTILGIAFDAAFGGKELTLVFTALYVLGCLSAVIAARQSALFTAVIQPPLILFCTVPTAYWLFHGAGLPGFKNVVINSGYPLIERFPLMLVTSATVLLIGMIRWYRGTVDRHATPHSGEAGARRQPGLIDKLAAILGPALQRSPAHAVEPRTARAPREPRPGGPPRRATAEARRAARESTASTTRTRSPERRESTDPTRSRPARPRVSATPMDPPRRRRPPAEQRDEPLQRRRRSAPEPPPESPRRGMAPQSHAEPPRRRLGPESPTEPTRRRRPVQGAPRGAEPGNHRDPRDPRAPRHLADSPEPLPRRRRSPAAAPSHTNGATHHPVSQVRYRNAASDEPRLPPRSRSPRSGNDADSWEFDI